MTTILSRTALCAVLLFASGNAAPAPRRSAQKELAALQDFVGPWRGVGQIRRGSNQGAWIEQAEWVWKFDDQTAAIEFKAPKAKHLRSGVITPSAQAGRLQLDALLADSTPVHYEGSVVNQKQDGKEQGAQKKSDSGRLVFEASSKQTTEKPTAPARITLRLTAGGKRLVVLLERRLGESRYARMAEIGYTRRGSQFGQGASYIECVVTGGLGTIPVTYEGQTYQVCCSGCRDLFDANPQTVLEEYRARLAAKKNPPEKNGRSARD